MREGGEEIKDKDKQEDLLAVPLSLGAGPRRLGCLPVWGQGVRAGGWEPGPSPGCLATRARFSTFKR